jgi:hypothetical protein
MMYLKLLARDLGIAGAAALLWILTAQRSAAADPLGDLAGLVTGVLVGIFAFLLHEWGHWLGAVATGSRVQPAKSLRSLFLFSFDSRQSSRRQFLALSFGGWLATLAFAFAAYAWLPPELLASRVARGMAMLSVLLVAVIEIPLVVWSLRTGRIPRVETTRYEPRRAAAA